MVVKKDYKTMQSELDSLLEWFESGDVDLDQATEKYEQALDLIQKMETYLKTAENKIEIIKAKSS